MSANDESPAAGAPADEAQRRIVEARMKLRGRFFDKMKATPAAADGKPLGSGPPNRHGMPQVPIGQFVTKGWPVLDLGTKPDIPLERWSLRVDGAVEEPLILGWKDFQALPQVEDVSDFHCVTTWSKLDVAVEGRLVRHHRCPGPPARGRDARPGVRPTTATPPTSRSRRR